MMQQSIAGGPMSAAQPSPFGATLQNLMMSLWVNGFVWVSRGIAGDMSCGASATLILMSRLVGLIL